MSITIFSRPGSILSHPAALRVSKSASEILRAPSFSLPYPLSLFTVGESQEEWTTYENLLLACLQTGNDQFAGQCIDRLTARFGATNERVMAFRGLYDEAMAPDDQALNVVLKGYDSVLKADPMNTPVRKRRIALLRSLDRVADSITALVEYLDFCPTDIEGWAELSDLYFSQGLYPQAIFSLEEVLLITPNAWNIHARMGELLYVSATNSLQSGESTINLLSTSMRRFCRSIELCDDYLRGYYGLKLTTKAMLDHFCSNPIYSNSKTSKLTTMKPVQSSTDFAVQESEPPTKEVVEKLHELATYKLAEILRRFRANESGWDGFDEAELLAARQLLDTETA